MVLLRMLYLVRNTAPFQQNSLLLTLCSPPAPLISTSCIPKHRAQAPAGYVGRVCSSIGSEALVFF